MLVGSGPLHLATVLAPAAPAVIVGERGCAERGPPQRPQQLWGERRPVLRAQYSLSEDRAEFTGERQPHEHQTGCRYQDRDQRGGDDSEGDGDTPATQEWYPTREYFAPALNEPQGEDRAADRQRRLGTISLVLLAAFVVREANCVRRDDAEARAPCEGRDPGPVEPADREAA